MISSRDEAFDLLYRLTLAERLAVGRSIKIFTDHGIEFTMPWEGALSDLEIERAAALVKALRAYKSS